MLGGVSHGLGLLHINLENKQIKTINSDDICPQMNSIVEDNVGNLWIGTLNGLIRFDPEKKHFLAYHSEDGTGNDTYAPMSAVAGWSGDVLMGGTKGLTVFNPTEIKPSERSNIHLEYVASNEELYKGGDKNRLKFVGDSITDVYLPTTIMGCISFILLWTLVTLTSRRLNSCSMALTTNGTPLKMHPMLIIRTLVRGVIYLT